jgi:methionyl-tRNA formyltransferase
MDSGPIIAQRTCKMKIQDHTLHSSFYTVVQTLTALFDERWDAIREGHYEKQAQQDGGNAHSMQQIMLIKDLLDEYEHQPVEALLAAIAQRHPGFALR